MRVVWLGRARYQPVLTLQERLREAVLAGGEETLLFVEHEPVITLGHRATSADLLVSLPQLALLGIETVTVRRGGQATYHGPGQLVVYPVVKLRGGVVGHVDWLTSAAVAVAASVGVRAEYRSDPVGVWVGSRKLGAVGVHVEHQVAIHGLSLNVLPEATAVFRKQLFVPCGHSGAQVTSLVEAGADDRTLTVSSVAERFAAALGAAYGTSSATMEACGLASFFDDVSSGLAG